MEKKMKDYILDDLNEYVKNVEAFEEEDFTNDVLKSFTDAKTSKHYVMLIPSNMDEYYSNEEHSKFRKNGYYQLMDDNRYNNRFFIPYGSIKLACDILEKEDMVVELANHKKLPIGIYLVTLNGRRECKFDEDFNQTVEQI